MIKSHIALYESERVGRKAVRGRKVTSLQSLGAPVSINTRLAGQNWPSSSISSSSPPSRALVRRSPRFRSPQSKDVCLVSIGNSSLDGTDYFEPDGVIEKDDRNNIPPVAEEAEEAEWDDLSDSGSSSCESIPHSIYGFASGSKNLSHFPTVEVFSPSHSIPEIPSPLLSVFNGDIHPLDPGVAFSVQDNIAESEDDIGITSSPFGSIRHWSNEAPIVSPPFVPSKPGSSGVVRISPRGSTEIAGYSVENVDVVDVSNALKAATCRLHGGCLGSQDRYISSTESTFETFDPPDQLSNVIIVSVHGVSDLGCAALHVICCLGSNIGHLIPAERDVIIQAAHHPSCSLDAFVFLAPTGFSWLFHLLEPRLIEASSVLTDGGGVVYVNPQFVQKDAWDSTVLVLTIGGLPCPFLYDTLMRLIRKQGGDVDVMYVTCRRKDWLFKKDVQTPLTLPCFLAFCKNESDGDVLSKRFKAQAGVSNASWFSASRGPSVAFPDLISHIYSVRVACLPIVGVSLAEGVRFFRGENPRERLFFFMQHRGFFVAIVCGRKAPFGYPRVGRWWGDHPPPLCEDIRRIEGELQNLNLLRAILVSVAGKPAVSGVSPSSPASPSFSRKRILHSVAAVSPPSIVSSAPQCSLGPPPVADPAATTPSATAAGAVSVHLALCAAAAAASSATDAAAAAVSAAIAEYVAAFAVSSAVAAAVAVAATATAVSKANGLALAVPGVASAAAAAGAGSVAVAATATAVASANGLALAAPGAASAAAAAGARSVVGADGARPSGACSLIRSVAPPYTATYSASRIRELRPLGSLPSRRVRWDPEVPAAAGLPVVWPGGHGALPQPPN